MALAAVLETLRVHFRRAAVVVAISSISYRKNAQFNALSLSMSQLLSDWVERFGGFW